MIHAAGMATALLLMAAGAPSAAANAWILTCNMAAPGEDPSGPNARRVFRLGRRLLQEWKPDQKQFGPNLCQSFSCIGASDRLQGVISSATLSLTISLDLATGRATWRTLGASGLRTTSGPCTVKLEEPPPAGGSSRAARPPSA
jgi:hypothetical protein